MGYTINDLTALGRNLDPTDLLEVSLSGGTGSRKITGQEIINAASGGAFVNATHVLIKPTSSVYIPNIWSSVNLNVFQIPANSLNLTAFIPAYDLQFNEIVMALSAGSAGLAKVVVYSDLNGKPDALLFESPDVNVSTAGWKIITGVNFTFAASTIYWISVCLDTFGANFRVFPVNSQAPVQPVIGTPFATQLSGSWGWYKNVTYSSLPANITGLTNGDLSTQAVPWLLFKAV